MSGVSSVGSSSIEAYQRIRQMASAQSSSKVKGPPSEEEMAADLCSKIGETGVDVEGLNLEEELTDAITTAVAKAQESGDTTDMRKVIEQAIDDTLKENGLDPESRSKSNSGRLADLVARRVEAGCRPAHRRTEWAVSATARRRAHPTRMTTTPPPRSWTC